MSSPQFLIHTDGGARGNPGPAAYAFVLSRPGSPDLEESGFLGETTNNIAEYAAVVKALEKAKELGGKRVLLKSDSELMVKQMNGLYKVRNEGLLPLYEAARRLTRAFEEVKFQHVRREQNSEADRLCNEAMDAALLGGGKPTPKRRVRGLKPAVNAETPPAEKDCWRQARTEGLARLQAAAQAWQDGEESPPVMQVWNDLLDVLERHGLLTPEAD